MAILEKFSDFMHLLTTKLGQLVSWMTLLMVILMTLVVVLRYGFNLGWIALQESVLYLHALALMLGMSVTLKLDQHVRVDIFYRRMTGKRQQLVDAVGHLVFLFPTCIFIIVMSWGYVMQSWRILEKSQEVGGLPLVFVLKSLLLIMPILLMLQALSQLLANTLEKKFATQTANSLIKEEI